MDGLQQSDSGISTMNPSTSASGGAAVAGDWTAFDHSPRTAWSTGAAAFFLFCVTVLLLTGAFGCSDQPSLIPNSDANLRKTKTEFAQDASQRHYQADAPRGGKANGRAIFDYQDNTLQVANFAPEDWTNVELWVNGKWVVYLPKVEGNAETAKTINFEMLYDERGRQFPNDNVNAESLVRKVEVLRDGKLYELAIAPAD